MHSGMSGSSLSGAVRSSPEPRQSATTFIDRVRPGIQLPITFMGLWDVDGDGISDVIVSDAGGQRIERFASQTPITLPAGPFVRSIVKQADIV